MDTANKIKPVRIKPDPNSPEIQERWRKKKEHIEQIASSIRGLRNKITRDLKSDDEKVCLTALVIAIIDNTAERVGNQDSEDNGHFGVTGFQKKHVSIEGNKVLLTYRGKSGVDHAKQFSDELIAKTLKQAMKESPVSFVFATSDGFRIKADKVNRYLSEYGITAKDLRGFHANNHIIRMLEREEIPAEEKKRKTVFNKAVKYAAKKVGHGGTTLKNHYLMPELYNQYVSSGKIIDLCDFNDGSCELGTPAEVKAPKLTLEQIRDQIRKDLGKPPLSEVQEEESIAASLPEPEPALKEAAGALLIAKDTKRILLVKRSSTEDQNRTWCTVGGNKEADETPVETALREMQEEIGFNSVTLIPSYVNVSDGYRFYNHIGFVDSEFVPVLNEEHTDYGWFALNNLPSPLHFGVIKLLENIDLKKMISDNCGCKHAKLKPVLDHLYKEHHGAYDFCDSCESLLSADESIVSTLSEKIIQLWNEELKEHFIDEEKNLFPELTGIDQDTDDAIALLIRQHWKLETMIGQIRGNKKNIDLIKAFIDDLRAHIKLEEKIFSKFMKDPYKEPADKLIGGKADNMSVSDIASLHGVNESQIQQQLKKGMKVESEHVSDEQLAREIAKDHLVESPNYYDKLEQMESGNSDLVPLSLENGGELSQGDKERQIAIATQIRNQIGRQALMMLGAYDIYADNGALVFKIKGSKKWKHIRISLNAKDLYDVTFSTWKKENITRKEVADVHIDNLHKVIEKETGLYTRLFEAGGTLQNIKHLPQINIRQFVVVYNTNKQLEKRPSKRGSMKTWVMARTREEAIAIVKNDAEDFGAVISAKPDDKYSSYDAVYVSDEVKNKLHVLNSLIGNKRETIMQEGGGIRPIKEVKANVKTSVAEVIQIPRFSTLTEHEGEFLYNNFRNNRTPVNLKGMGKVLADKLEEKFYIENAEWDSSFEEWKLTEYGEDFIKTVDERLATRKRIKAGVDMFPLESGLPELQPRVEVMGKMGTLKSLLTEPNSEIPVMSSPVDRKGNPKEAWMLTRHEVERSLQGQNLSVIRNSLQSTKAKIERALSTATSDLKGKDSVFVLAIRAGLMTPDDAINVIQSYGLDVPDEIFALKDQKHDADVKAFSSQNLSGQVITDYNEVIKSAAEGIQRINLSENQPVLPKNYLDFAEKLIEDTEGGIKYTKATLESTAVKFGINEKNIAKEMAELAIVIMARRISLSNPDNQVAFDKLVGLYSNQVNLSHRTSESIMLQQYSTPAPIGYLMGMYCKARSRDGIYFEPSAGNGLLTIYGYPSTFIVNEIDKVRNMALAAQGYKEVLRQDASLPFVGYEKYFDAVITNPPFGKLDTAVDYSGFKIVSLEQQMVINALSCMKDTGRCAFIIGGHTDFDKEGRIQAGKNRIFFAYLFKHYNVEDMINIDGHALYSRQGTAFNTRLVLINGRKQVPGGFPPLLTEKLDNSMPYSPVPVDDFQVLFDRVKAL